MLVQVTRSEGGKRGVSLKANKQERNRGATYTKGHDSEPLGVVFQVPEEVLERRLCLIRQRVQQFGSGLGQQPYVVNFSCGKEKGSVGQYSTFPVLRDSTVERQDSSKPTKSAAPDTKRQRIWLQTRSFLSSSIVNVRP